MPPGSLTGILVSVPSAISANPQLLEEMKCTMTESNALF